MQSQATTATNASAEPERTVGGKQTRELMRSAALRNAIQKRADGVPTYTVPEAAALLSISQEYLYRLIQADMFPAVHMRIGRNQGRYVVPAKVVEKLLDDAARSVNSLDLADWAGRCGLAGGAA